MTICTHCFRHYRSSAVGLAKKMLIKRPNGARLWKKMVYLFRELLRPCHLTDVMGRARSAQKRAEMLRLYRQGRIVHSNSLLGRV